MDCSTCHDTHRDDHGDAAAYSQRCQSCHAIANHNFCTIPNQANIAGFAQNCTKCHMPAQASDIIKVRTGETHKTGETQENTSIFMVNHRIAVYPPTSRSTRN